MTNDAARPIPCPPSAVLFDMDGVLVDTFAAWVGVLDACRMRRGLSPLGPGPVRSAWGQGILADCETFFPGADPQELAGEYGREFSLHIDRVLPEPGAAEAVGALRAGGIPLALVTNSPAALARRILLQVGLSEAFPVVAGGDEVLRSKPDPDLLHLALARLGLSAGGAVMVGDTVLDVQAAGAAGIPVIGYRVRGDVRVDHLADIPPLLGIDARVG